MAELFLRGARARAVPVTSIDASYQQDLATLGRPSVAKAVRFLGHLGRALLERWRGRWDIAVLVPSFRRANALRDATAVLALRALTGGRVVLWVHSNDLADLLARVTLVERAYLRLAHRLVLRHVVVGHALAGQLDGLVAPDRVHALPNGIPDEPLPERVPDGGAVRFIFLSNMLRAKGWPVLLEAARRLLPRHPQARFDFYGAPTADAPPGDLRAAFDGPGASPRIVYHGPIEGAAKLAALAGADVLVLPSTYPAEALPLVVLEAMRSGLAVIATARGAIAEAVAHGQGGLLLAEPDLESLTGALEALIVAPRRARAMGAHNRRVFEAEYALDRHIDRWVALLTSLGPGTAAEVQAC
jgi:glycosyltransferase involved in cell wall biosynthesis